MLPLLFAVAMATPRSLLAESTGDLFRDPLDLMAQPATLAGLEGNDLITLLSARSTGGLFSAGWIGQARRVGLGIYVGGGMASSRSASGEGEDASFLDLTSQRVWVADLSLGIPLRAGHSIGLRGWSDGGASRRSVAWAWEEDVTRSDTQPANGAQGPLPAPASEVRFLQHRTGGSLGFRGERPGRYTEVDIEVERTFARSTLLLYDPTTDAAAVGFRSINPSENQALWSPGVRIDALRDGSRKTSLRIWNRTAIDLGGLARPGYIERSPDGVEEELRWVRHLYAGARTDLLVAAHVRWQDLELRLGGRMTASYLSFQGQQQGDVGYPDWLDGSQIVPSDHAVSATLSLPISVSAPVSHQVSLFAGGSVTWRLNWSQLKDDGEDTAQTSLSQDGFGGGALGVRWLATGRVTLDLATSLRTRSTTTAINLSGSSYPFGASSGGTTSETYQPAYPNTTNYETTLSGNGPILGASGSLIIHL